MKNLNKIFFSVACGALLGGTITSCDDFEEINIDPSATGKEYMHPDYPLNNSFYNAQMDPHIGERIFVYNWASITRVVGENTFGETGRYANDYVHDYYNSYISQWIKNATLAIQLADENPGTTEHERAFFPNVKQFARIWRAILIAEFADNFGPYPLNSFQGVNPTFNSVEDVYDFILTELADAPGKIDPSVVPTEQEKKGDPAFAYDGAKWIKLANSLRMRYALRLTNVDNARAKTEFEAAAKGALLTDEFFDFPEAGGWSAYESVLNRPYSAQAITSTMCNLLAGLGGVSVTAQRPDLAAYVKPINYIGEEYANHFLATTDNPTKQMWMDGIPELLDPRALVLWCLSNDESAANFPTNYGAGPVGVANHDKYGMLDPNDTENYLVNIDAQFTWNGYPAGARSAWSPSLALNSMVGYPSATFPLLAQKYRDNTLRRIWMAPWETYFLLAEGAVYGWATPISAEDAYENGVRVNFDYHGVGQFANQYLASETYNRVGTSVSFTHTAEPVDFEADYVNGYTKVAGKKTYHYPDPSKILYKGGKLNDQLTKIITQKFIANTPYGALEMWNDRRRLGLPFFEIVVNEGPMTGSDKEKFFSADDWKTGQKWSHFSQRLRYPTSLENADKVEYQNALKLLGTEENTMMAPLWWAIK